MVSGLLELLDQLDERGVDLSLTAGPGPGPLLRTDAPRGAITTEVADALGRHRSMVIAVLLGRLTGHAPGPCTTCGEISMVAILTSAGKPRASWPTCRFTSSCTNGASHPTRGDVPGRHVPRPTDIERTARVAPPAQAKPPPTTDKRRLLGSWPEWPS